MPTTTATTECTPLSKETAPTNLTLSILHRELNNYAMGITSERGGGAHGHLGLVMTAAEYLIIANQAYVHPVHPGVNPLPGLTAPQITENNRIHAAAITEFKTYRETEATLKRMLLQAVPSTYTEELQDHQLGYAKVTTKDILAHLDTTYGTVSFDDLTKNLENLHTPWNGDKPIETLWAQVQHAKAYAASHDPITDKALIMSVITNLTNTGLFGDDLKQWNLKEIADQTWPKLKIHFNKANHHRLKTATVASAGYKATEEEKENIKPEQKMTGRNRKNTPENWMYCWMHGLNRSHTSNTCRYPNEGHKTTATLNNMQQGSNMICPRLERHNNRQQQAPNPTPNPTTTTA
jgi:hypothetical protein